MKRLLTVLLVIMAITNFLIPSNVLAARQTIIIDGAVQQEWTTVGTTLSDLAGDVSGAGPHDLVKFSTTNDDTYIYARWDAIASYTDVKSLAYGIALTSVMPSGGTIPTAEVIAYVEYDNKQDVIVALENSSREVVTIESGVTISTSVYAQVEEYTVGGVTYCAIEAKFPFASFSAFATPTTNPIDSTATFPLWGVALASGSYASNVKDYVPEEDSYIIYDSNTGTGTVVSSDPDTTAPYVPDSTLTTSNATISSIQVDWTKAEDDFTLQSNLVYEVFYSTSDNIQTLTDITANGTSGGSGTDIDTYTVTGLSPNTTYYFNVVVTDAAGNQSVYTSAPGTTLPDTTPPSSTGTVTASTPAVSPETNMNLNWPDAVDDYIFQPPFYTSETDRRINPCLQQKPAPVFPCL